MSYAHKDMKLARALRDALQELLQCSKHYAFEGWDDAQLQAGERWFDSIQGQIKAADLGLLMLSPSFLASRFIAKHELPAFVAGTRSELIGKRVVPAALRKLDLHNRNLRGLEAHQIFGCGEHGPFPQRRGQRRDAWVDALAEQIHGLLGRYTVVSAETEAASTDAGAQAIALLASDQEPAQGPQASRSVLGPTPAQQGAAEPASRTTRVFVSYSHDSSSHQDAVLALSNRLRSDGIDCHIDQYEIAPPEGWPRWMDRYIEESDFVLVVCTDEYRKRFDGKATLGVGRGVKWESMLTHAHLCWKEALNPKFVPVFPAAVQEDHIPTPLFGVSHYALGVADGYEGLLRRLRGIPGAAKPPLGQPGGVQGPAVWWAFDWEGARKQADFATELQVERPDGPSQDEEASEADSGPERTLRQS